MRHIGGFLKRTLQIALAACACVGVPVLMRTDLSHYVPYDCAIRQFSDASAPNGCSPERIWQDYGSTLFNVFVVPFVIGAAVAGCVAPLTLFPGETRAKRLAYAIMTLSAVPLIAVLVDFAASCLSVLIICALVAAGLVLRREDGRVNSALIVWSVGLLALPVAYMFLVGAFFFAD